MRYSGKVQSGFGRGQQLGFPTYNLEIPPALKATYGIYAAWVWIHEKKFGAACHYGPVPTFQRDTPSLEFYVLEYVETGSIKSIEFELVKKTREILRFANPTDLQKQISEDVVTIKSLLKLS